VNTNIKWEYKIGSRKVSKREWERHIFRDEPQRIARDKVQKALSGVVCPEHGEAPRLEFVNTNKGFDVLISACCEELETTAEQNLEGILQ
jgi:hypothetical protein